MADVMSNERVTIEAILATPELVEVLDDLYESDIKVAIGWVYAPGIDIAIGDKTNGYTAEGQAATLTEAAEWLRRKGVENYPDSEFAKKHAASSSPRHRLLALAHISSRATRLRPVPLPAL